jgi:hypothetical protein
MLQLRSGTILILRELFKDSDPRMIKDLKDYDPLFFMNNEQYFDSKGGESAEEKWYAHEIMGFDK